MRTHTGKFANGPARGFAVAAIVLLATIVSTFPSLAVEEVNVGEGGYILHGYDAVAYQSQGRAVPGKSAYEAEFGGARYKFSNAENLAAFQSTPQKFAPAYGGWCAYGVRVGKKFDVDPKTFQVVDGRLFLQLDQGTQKVWLKDRDKNIAVADRLWPSLEKVSRKILGN